MIKSFHIFSLKKEGHYSDYSKVIMNLLNDNGFRVVLVESVIKQIFFSFFLPSVIYIDGDKRHLFFAPIIVIRSWFGLKNYMLSIRTEKIIDSRFQKIIKLPIYLFIRKFSDTKIISIHKENIRQEYNKYITNFIYDIQYWDINYLDINLSMPSELENLNLENSVAIIGDLNVKKSKEELLSFLKDSKTNIFTFIFAGRVNKDDLEYLNMHEKCIIINRYISNEELNYIYKISDYVWCYYSPEVNRPSGIFGRAMQFKKKIIVRENGYLSKTNDDYPCLIKIKNLSKLLEINYKQDCSNENWINKKDSSKELLDILSQ